MPLPIQTDTLPVPAQRVLSGQAPPAATMMAARGVMPGHKPHEIVTVVACLTTADDPEVAATARKTMGALPAPMLNGALAVDLDPGVADRLATAYLTNHDVMARLLRLPRLHDDTLLMMAEGADEKLGELIATNEQRMLATPAVIEKLYLNKRVRMSTSDRLIELAVRNGIKLGFEAFAEAAEAIQTELIPEATEEPTYDDVLFQESVALGEETSARLGDDDTHERDEGGEEKIKDLTRPLWAIVDKLTVTQKIRLATLGKSAERLFLVRDKNRLVAESAAKSPLLTDNDAARIAMSRAVSEGVLRVIAQRKEFRRSYPVQLALVQNPRTPFTFASHIVPMLRDNDVRALARSKHVPNAVQIAARRQLSRKAAGKG
ncbi:MAG: hypothetical protein JW751_15035 [Polyangiaceae bacterium]|nr:hypothetical protein [Polyangiaceae bacterium]